MRNGRAGGTSMIDGRKRRGVGLLLVWLALAGMRPATAVRGDLWTEFGLPVSFTDQGIAADGYESVLLRQPSDTPEAAFAADEGIVVSDGDEGHTEIAGPLTEMMPTEEGGVFASETCPPGWCCGRQACGPVWSLQVDALMLWRSNMQSLPLFTNAQGRVALDAGQVFPPMSTGPRVGLVRQLNACTAIEGNYFYVSPFSTLRVRSEGGPFTMMNFGDLVFDDLTSATLSSNARLQSAELNWRRSFAPAFTWLAGFRWVEWNEQWASTYQFANPNPANLGSGITSAQTGNNLYGGQLGLDALLWNGGSRWTVNGVGKAGLFYNRAVQTSTSGFVPLAGAPYTLPAVSAARDQAAFFGEVGVNSTFWVTPWLAWRVGYSVFWLSGVAVAPQQFPLADYGAGTTTINTNGSVFLQGVTTGLEARW